MVDKVWMDARILKRPSEHPQSGDVASTSSDTRVNGNEQLEVSPSHRTTQERQSQRQDDPQSMPRDVHPTPRQTTALVEQRLANATSYVENL